LLSVTTTSTISSPLRIDTTAFGGSSTKLSFPWLTEFRKSSTLR